MNYELPDFDTLLALSKSDPHALDRIKQEAAAALIDDAPERCRQSLRGIQFQVDMELRKAKSPLDGCIRTSRLMQESLAKLRAALNNACQETSMATISSVDKNKVVKRPTTAVILPFHQIS